MTDIAIDESYPIIKVEALNYAYAKPIAQAQFKTHAADFIVREKLSFEPEGEGTHAYLYIKKINTNTQWLAKQLAEFVGVAVKEIGYAGLKDRNAITYQWFSINLEILEKKPVWDDFKLEGVSIEQQTLHRRKLKKGVIEENQFEIILRNIEHTSIVQLKEKIQIIEQSGIPNYFAQQRFGHNYNNLTRAVHWFNGTNKVKKRADKSILLSAARSMIFNTMLSQRMAHYSWNELLSGEVMMLAGTHSIFSTDTIDDILKQRFHQADIHPTATMWGKGQLASKEELLSFEQNTAEKLSAWCKGLEQQGLKQDRRAIRVFPKNINIEFFTKNNVLDSDIIDHIRLNFSLPTGSYATAVLREIVHGL